MNDIEYNHQYKDKKDINKIRVAVRKRPLNKKEYQKNDIDIIEMKDSQTLIVKELKNKFDLTKYIEEHHFSFDSVFDETSTNDIIYNTLVRPMVEAAFETKTKVTCFAYGQTGSGKTYTMMGPGLKDGTIPGLYLLSAFDIISFSEKDEFSHLKIYISFYEIYCNKLYDLLNERNLLHAREDGKQNICIVGLQERQVNSLKEFMNIIEFGLKTRTTGITGANSDSSRSHAILQICLKDSNSQVCGKISFIDLAGSERAVDTIDTNKQTKIDGAEINKSLLALKECIRALDQEKKHTPFRGSKLTLVLRDSFVGNCKTLMIANISPGLSCSEHTLNTLRYADRVKELKKEKERETIFEKDERDEFVNAMMMPRQHSKTVKYSIDNKVLNKFNNQFQSGQMRHINNILSSQSSNFIKEPVRKLSTNNKENHICANEDKGKSKERMISSEYKSKFLTVDIKTDEDYQKLTHEHENLINEILQHEEDFIVLHKEHIDETVDIVKQVRNTNYIYYITYTI